MHAAAVAQPKRSSREEPAARQARAPGVPPTAAARAGSSEGAAAELLSLIGTTLLGAAVLGLCSAMQYARGDIVASTNSAWFAYYIIALGISALAIAAAVVVASWFEHD